MADSTLSNHHFHPLIALKPLEHKIVLLPVKFTRFNRTGFASGLDSFGVQISLLSTPKFFRLSLKKRVMELRNLKKPIKEHCSSGNPCRSGSSLAFSLLEVVVSLALISILVGFFVVHFSVSDQEGAGDEFRRKFEQLIIGEARSSNAFGEDRVIVIGQNEILSESKKLAVPDSIRLQLRRLNETQFRYPAADQWVFYAKGLIEPIEFRIISESSTVDLVVDPLTARPVVN